MKITDIKVYLLKKQLSSSMQISRGGFKVRLHTIIKVETDEGTYGLGEAVGNADYCKALLEGPVKDRVLGMNPFQIEKIKEKLTEGDVYFERMGSVLCALSAIEMACLDIKGKALNIPAYELLGGMVQENLEVYASDVYWEDDPDLMTKRAEVIQSKGINNIKAHVGVHHPRAEFETIAALAETMTKGRFMLDLNAGYDLPTAQEALDLYYDLGPLWVEEPLNPESINAMKNLKAGSNVSLAYGENEYTRFGFHRLFENTTLDYAMPDIARTGGILETKVICDLAKIYGIIVTPHNFSSGILLAATMHLMHSTSNTKYLEFDSSSNAVYTEFFEEKPIIKDGHTKISDYPGLGITLKDEILNEYAI